MNAFSAAPLCIPELESVISTDELNRRPSHPPNHAEENRALIALARELATSPSSMLQKLAETALTLCRAHSAGISLLEEGRKRFQWKAIAGQWAAHLGGGTPRGFGPCGTVLDRDVALLFSHPERHFSYLADVTPCIDEGLLLPFYVDGEGVGTIWVIAHDQSVRFDSEDVRVMTSLASFASTAYQTLVSLERKLEAEAQRTQLLQETDKLQKALLNSISHDLRTPLASIIGALDSVLEDWKVLDVHTQHLLLETAQGSARRLSQLVQNLLDMTRLEGGALHLNIVRCDTGCYRHGYKAARGGRTATTDYRRCRGGAAARAFGFCAYCAGGGESSGQRPQVLRQPCACPGWGSDRGGPIAGSHFRSREGDSRG